MASHGMNRLEEEDEPSAVPKVRAYLIGAILLVNGFSAMLVFPMAPAMTHHFFPSLGQEELGYQAGYLSSVFFFGSFFGALFWGWACDAFGRRPCLIAGIAGTLCSVTFFGFSTSFALALVARFLWGALNGNIGVAKTYMSEICDDSNQARGMAIIAAQGGLGRLTGPAVGGFLADPAAQYPALKGIAFFMTFPYALPCLVGALLAFCCLVGAVISLQAPQPYP